MISLFILLSFFIFFIAVLICLPRSVKVELSALPSPAWIYLQIVLSLFYKKLIVKKRGPKIEVNLTKPVRISPTRFQGFMRLTGFAGQDGKVEPASAIIPASYPFVESFRLTMQALAHPQFPFPILGSVLSKNRSILLREIHHEDKLFFDCTVNPNYRITDKGHVEVDVVTCAHAMRTANDRGSGSSNVMVWKNTLTIIILTKRMKKKDESSAAASGDTSPSFGRLVTWHLTGDVGRRYGGLSGDLNPIHLSAVTARPFGFQRPIAHAMFLVAKAEAALRSAGLDPEYPYVLETEFKRPTLLPATLAFGLVGSTSSSTVKGLENVKLSKGGVQFAVKSEPTAKSPAKDVLVGKIIKFTDGL